MPLPHSNFAVAAFELLPMQAQHMAAVMAVQAACYHAIQPESLAAMAAKRVAGDGLSMVAREKVAKRIDAYLIAMPVRWPALPELDSLPVAHPAPDTLYLHDLALHPRARGTGVAAQLVQQVLAAGQRAGFQQAALVAIQGSAPFWQRFGFAVVTPDAMLATQLGSYGDDAQLMRCHAW